MSKTREARKRYKQKLRRHQLTRLECAAMMLQNPAGRQSTAHRKFVNGRWYWGEGWSLEVNPSPHVAEANLTITQWGMNDIIQTEFSSRKWGIEKLRAILIERSSHES